MKKHEIENKMLELSFNRDVAGLTNLVSDLNQQIRKMDAWFDLFLDKFDRKLDTSKTDTPIWKMYNKKFTEYEDLKQTIKRVSYYREKYVNI